MEPALNTLFVGARQDAESTWAANILTESTTVAKNVCQENTQMWHGRSHKPQLYKLNYSKYICKYIILNGNKIGNIFSLNLCAYFRIYFSFPNGTTYLSSQPNKRCKTVQSNEHTSTNTKQAHTKH